MMRSIRHSLSISLALLCHAIVWWIAFDLYPRLPARIPMKYDMSGEPTRFVETTGGEWFALPAIATLITLMLICLGPLSNWLARENPEFINVPRKEDFMKRPPSEREAIVAPIGRALAWLAVLVNALFAWILYGTEKVGNGEWSRLPPWPLAGFFVLLALVLVPPIVKTFRAARPDPRGSATDSQATG